MANELTHNLKNSLKKTLINGLDFVGKNVKTHQNKVVNLTAVFQALPFSYLFLTVLSLIPYKKTDLIPAQYQTK